MKNLAKSILDLFPNSLTSPLIARYRNLQSRKQAEQWIKNGKPGAAPHVVKQEMILRLGQQFACRILVESGTFMGDMVEAQKNNFDCIYSIELSHELWKQACQRFEGKKHIEIRQGDSGKVMADITSGLQEKTLFWLDGHYSGGITAKAEKECPIYEELESILQHNSMNHVILIDDARLFDGTHDYPKLDELLSSIMPRLGRYSAQVENDIICLLPESPTTPA